jgi:hypothetical protein
VTLQGASSSEPPAQPAAKAPDVAGWSAACAVGAGPVQQTAASHRPHADPGLAPAHAAVLGGRPGSLITLLTVLVAVVFVARLLRLLTGKIRPALDATDSQQHGDGNTKANPTAVAARTDGDR